MHNHFPDATELIVLPTEGAKSKTDSWEELLLNQTHQQEMFQICKHGVAFTLA